MHAVDGQDPIHPCCYVFGYLRMLTQSAQSNFNPAANQQTDQMKVVACLLVVGHFPVDQFPGGGRTDKG
ncbi:Hypothetical predicted protein [Olea europaea subsp. europaea]|uniref:Uncharacterized protein n=1 Tax=Olea europaea subsp. europaea TaxID=158383 RepID=A0A8S0TDB4_OLEEU|nr:Hypothetical predicted protein [Olea europaea subsp. europaea]